jgi:hypothetical protein
MRRNSEGIRIMENVPMASVRRNLSVSLGNAMEDMEAKKKALRPNAASGIPVAVPRWFGQFIAAAMVSAASHGKGENKCQPVLMAPKNANAAPEPVMKDRIQMTGSGTEPGPST